MAKKAKRRPLADRYKQQVLAESLLRFNPEISSTKATLQDLAGQRDQSIASAGSAAHGARVAISSALPQVKDAYGSADAAVARAAQEIGLPAVASLGPSQTDAIRAATSRDVAGARTRTATGLADAIQQFQNRGVDAAHGYLSAVSQAQGTYAEGAGKLRDRLGQIAKEQGAFAQGRTGQLVQSALGRGVTRRGQDVTSASAQAGRQIAKDRLAETRRHNLQIEKGSGKGAAKPATAKEHGETADSISSALQQAKQLRGAKLTRQEAAGALVGGIPAGSKVDEAKYKKLVDQGVDKAVARRQSVVKSPAIKAVKRTHASVALDLAYDGHISRPNIDRLHQLGYSVKEIERLMGQPLNIGRASKPGGGRGNRTTRPATPVTAAPGAPAGTGRPG